MLKTILLATIRAYKRNFAYTFINFIGLSLALTVCLFTYLYVHDEYSYDDFHREPESLLLLERIEYKTDVSSKSGVFDIKQPKGLTRDYYHEDWQSIEAELNNDPYIEETITLKNHFLRINDGSEQPKFADTKGVSPNFFKQFSFEFLHGNSHESLTIPNSVVVTDDFAVEHFGKTNVIGDSIALSGMQNKTAIINGVIAKTEHTIFSFDIITTESSLGVKGLASDPVVFIRTSNKSRDIELAERIRNYYIRSLAINLEAKRTELRLSMINPVVDFRLIPVNKIYMDPSVRYGRSSHPIVSIVLIAISVVLLLVACVNYLSISIATSSRRRTEIAMRKAVGASPQQLKIQFYAEAFLITMLSVLGAFIITQLMMSDFRVLAQKDIHLSLEKHLLLLIYGVIFGFVLTLLTGTYPAHFLSQLNIVKGLKGNSTSHSKTSIIKVMTILQFALCLGFLNMTFIMKKQMNFVFTKDLGYKTQGMVLMRSIGPKNGSLMKDELLKNPSVISATQFTGFFGIYVRDSSVNNEMYHDLITVHMDQDLLHTLEIPFIDKHEYPAPERIVEGKIYVNEFYYNQLKLDTPSFQKLSSQIGGVIEDFHSQSLYRRIGPVVTKLVDKKSFWSLLVKFDSESREESLKIINDTYAEITDGPPVKTEFLSDYTKNQVSYKDTQRWIKVLNTASTLGMIITCVGLFGLVGITTSNRQKEMSIRKVLGARFSNIFLIVNKPFLTILLFGLALSAPLSYLIMAKWLDNFAYHVDLNPTLFWKSLVIVLIMIFLVGYFYTLKSQRENPAYALKND